MNVKNMPWISPRVDAFLKRVAGYYPVTRCTHEVLLAAACKEITAKVTADVEANVKQMLSDHGRRLARAFGGRG